MAAASATSNTAAAPAAAAKPSAAAAAAPIVAHEPAFAVIGGSSFLESRYFASFQPFIVETPYGSIKLRRGALKNVIFVQVTEAAWLNGCAISPEFMNCLCSAMPQTLSVLTPHLIS